MVLCGFWSPVRRAGTMGGGLTPFPSPPPTPSQSTVLLSHVLYTDPQWGCAGCSPPPLYTFTYLISPPAQHCPPLFGFKSPPRFIVTLNGAPLPPSLCCPWGGRGGAQVVPLRRVVQVSVTVFGAINEASFLFNYCFNVWKPRTGFCSTSGPGWEGLRALCHGGGGGSGSFHPPRALY